MWKYLKSQSNLGIKVTWLHLAEMGEGEAYIDKCSLDMSSLTSMLLWAMGIVYLSLTVEHVKLILHKC